MASTAKEVDVVQCVLEGIQEELRALCGGWIWRTFMGNGPSEGFACQLSEMDARGRMSGSVRGAWRITHTDIVALSTSFAIPPPGHGSGMYYDRASFHFVVSPDNSTVVVGSCFGPRFGRGIKYQVVASNGGHPALRLMDGLWKS